MQGLQIARKHLDSGLKGRWSSLFGICIIKSHYRLQYFPIDLKTPFMYFIPLICFEGLCGLHNLQLWLEYLRCSCTTVGKNVGKLKVGDQVCALLGGGGYAEKVAVHSGHVLPVPKGVSLQEAAALSEVSCTVWSTVFMTSHLSSGENFLVHGGSSGIGTFSIQIAKHIGAKVFVTAGSEEKLNRCKEFGADVAINYKTEDFVSRVKEETRGKGVDVILDNMGGPYLQRNLDSLGLDGRLFIIGFQGGSVTEINLSSVFARRLTIQAAGLQTRTVENKAHIIADVQKHVWPAIEEGKVKPLVYVSLPLSQVAESHRIMESSSHIGKILLTT